MFNKLKLLLILNIGFLLSPFHFIFAQVTPPAERFKNLAGKSGYNIGVTGNKMDIVVNVIIYVLGFVGLFFLIMVIYSGIQWISAGGNEDTITKAKTRLKNSIIGFAIIVLAYALTVFVSRVLQSSLSNTTL